jgi:thymidylate kinase
MIKDIIIEGLDRTGKGTQIQNLWTYLNHHYPTGCNIIRGDKMKTEHLSKTEDIAFRSTYANSINMTFQNMIQARANNFQGIRLYDRLHLSEVVYGQKYRKYDCNHIYKIENAVANLDDVYLITFIDDVENLYNRDDGEGFTSDPKEMKDEISRFREAHNDSSIKNKKIINISTLSIEMVFSIILNFIGE